MVLAGVVEAAAGPGETLQQVVDQAARGGEPALVEGAAVQRQEPFGHAGVVVQEGVAGVAAVLPGVEQAAAARRGGRGGAALAIISPRMNSAACSAASR